MRSLANDRCTLMSFCLAIGKRTLRAFTSQVGLSRKPRSTLKRRSQTLELEYLLNMFLPLCRSLCPILGIHLLTGDEVKLASSKPVTLCCRCQDIPAREHQAHADDPPPQTKHADLHTSPLDDSCTLDFFVSLLHIPNFVITSGCGRHTSSLQTPTLQAVAWTTVTHELAGHGEDSR